MSKNPDPGFMKDTLNDIGDPKDKEVVVVDARPRVIPIRPI